MCSTCEPPTWLERAGLSIPDPSDPSDPSDPKVWSEGASKYYIVTKPRCKMCQLPLKDGDHIFFGLPLPRDPNRPLLIFRQGAKYNGGNCIIGIGPSLGATVSALAAELDCFHGRCYRRINAFQITPRFRAAVQYSFLPPLQEISSKQRDNRLCAVMVRNLIRDKWPMMLPNEVWFEIARKIPFEVFFAAVKEHVDNSHTSDSVVELSCHVYAQFVNYEGIYYLKKLSNSAISGGQGGMLLFRGQPTRLVRKIYIAEDHLGVRCIKFVSANDQPGHNPTIAGVWWRCISELKGINIVRAMTDGFKVRDVRLVNSQTDLGKTPQYEACLRWQVWDPPRVAFINLETLTPSLDCCGFMRMSSFDCNGPGVTGYSVAFNQDWVFTIRSHHGDMDRDLSFYNDLKPHGVPIIWTYMPIAEDEHVTDIARFRAVEKQIPSALRGLDIITYPPMGLTFTTSRGRAVVFGKRDRMGRRVVRLYSFGSRDLKRIYFNVVDQLDYHRGIRIMACGDQQSPVSMRAPNSAFSMERNLRRSRESFYSSCEMKGVTRITPCIGETHPIRPVIGMLLDYEDGHRECLGQMRFDWIASPLEVSEGSKLHIGMTKPDMKRPLHICTLVATVTLTQSEDTDGPFHPEVNNWINVPWSGTLEWWFSTDSTTVKHHNKVRGA
ncbi:hypothetical protein F5Y06DRAFT_304880 [Hypoxylon sp. FL0890]|nr:hypothetical protein F5Y06DRAFT_304880 [Hypoxylon sp. FL0890]